MMLYDCIIAASDVSRGADSGHAQADGGIVTLGEALRTVTGTFETHTIRGTRARPVRPEIKVRGWPCLCVQ